MNERKKKDEKQDIQATAASLTTNTDSKVNQSENNTTFNACFLLIEY